MENGVNAVPRQQRNHPTGTVLFLVKMFGIKAGSLDPSDRLSPYRSVKGSSKGREVAFVELVHA